MSDFGAAFKNACHFRGLGVALLLTARPLRATVVTEISSALPHDDVEGAFLTITLRMVFKTAAMLRERGTFSVNLMRHSDLEAVKRAYAGNMDSLRWEYRGNTPYVPDCNASFFCSVERFIDVGLSQLFVGRVDDLIAAERPEMPLINYNRTYCTIGGASVPAGNETVQNARLSN